HRVDTARRQERTVDEPAEGLRGDGDQIGARVGQLERAPIAGAPAVTRDGGFPERTELRLAPAVQVTGGGAQVARVAIECLVEERGLDETRRDAAAVDRIRVVSSVA